MKKFTIACGTMLATITMNAQVQMPAASPSQTIKQDFGIGSIEINYSRPGAKGRNVFGGLESYGKIWRTGANTATRIKLTEPVELGGKKVDTGTYALYTVPGAEMWEVIINKGINNWGIDGYKESEDVVRFKVAPVKLKKIVETFTIQFENMKPDRCDLVLMWDKTSITIPVTANFKEKIRAQIEAGMQTDKKPYWAAAQFYNEYDKNRVKALDNVNKAIAENEKAYWMLLYKAKIQEEMGDKAGALISSKQSQALAKEAQNDAYVKLNEELQKKLQ